MKPAAPATDTPPPRRKAWWRRVLKGFLWTSGLLVTGAVVAWQFRTPIANAVLRRVSPDFPASVESLGWEKGGLTLRNLTLKTSDGSETILRLPEGHVELGIRKAPSGNLGRIELQGPEIQLGKGFWREIERLGKAAAPTETAKEAGTGQVFSTAGIDIRAGKVRMEVPDGGLVSGELEWQGGSVAYFADGAAAATRQTIKLRHLKYDSGPEAAPLAAAELVAEFSLEEAGRKLTVHHLKATGLDAPAGEAFWKSLGLSGLDAGVPAGEAPEAAAAPAQAARPMIEKVEIEDCAIGPVAIAMDSLPWVPGLPPVRAKLTITGGNIAGNTDGTTGGSLLQVTIEDAVLGKEPAAPWVTVPKFSASLAMDPAGNWKIDHAELAPSPVRFNRQLAEELKLPSGLPIPEISAEVSARFSSIDLGPDGVKTGAAQQVSIGNAIVKRPEAAEPLATWKSLTVEAAVPEVFEQKRLRRLTWEEPAIIWSGDDMKFFSQAAESAENPANPPVESAAEAEGTPFWNGLRCDDLKVTGGSVAGRQLGGGIPDASLKFKILTAPLTPGGEVFHQLTCEELRVAQPDFPQAPPLFRGQSLRVSVHPEQLWSKRRIESVHLLGSQMEIGATDRDLYVPESDQTPAATYYESKKPAVIDEIKAPTDWHVRQVVLENTQIHLHGLVPDVSEIVVPISQKIMQYVPLTPEGLRQSEERERIELPLVYVPGTRPGTSVADLDTNFVYFSLAGLMQKRIDLVEAVNPKIYVGDSLFHYVEKFRTESTPPQEPIAAQAQEILASLITLLTAEEPAPPSDGWSITRLRLINGKLFSTVKDSPIFRVPPMPFGADSSLAEGEINAELAVPPGIYKPVLGLELVARINEGRIVFNLPKKGRDNNLVQVFKADWLRYKQFRIADVALSVTYDENGIYTKFWAKGYGGDLEGAFNLYLDDQLSWDMWVAGSNVDVGEITKTLTPNYFTMDGRINFKVIAQGDRASLYQATGEFNGLVPGRMKIVALEDLIKEIPDDWTELERKWTIKALETLRDFRYDKCTGDLRFYGLEGTIHLRLAGPDGQRNFEVNSHDRRLRVEPKP